MEGVVLIVGGVIGKEVIVFKDECFLMVIDLEGMYVFYSFGLCSDIELVVVVIFVWRKGIGYVNGLRMVYK